MKRIYRNALILLFVALVFSALVFGWRMALSVLVGGGLAVLNFHWMSAGVEKLLGAPGKPNAGPVVARYLARLVLIFGTFFVIIHTSFLDVFGALVGLSVFVLSGMSEAVILLFKGPAGMR